MSIYYSLIRLELLKVTDESKRTKFYADLEGRGWRKVGKAKTPDRPTGAWKKQADHSSRADALADIRADLNAVSAGTGIPFSAAIQTSNAGSPEVYEKVLSPTLARLVMRVGGT